MSVSNQPSTLNLTPEEAIPEEIDLIALGRAIWNRRLFVLSNGAIFAVIGLFFSLVIPKTFIAEATILPTTTIGPASGLAAGLAAQLGPAAGMLGNISGGNSADLVDVLNSRTIAERVIKSCGLEKKITGWEYRSELIKKVRNMTKITGPSLKMRSISITIKANSPEHAAEIANSYVIELKHMLDQIGYNSASKHRRYIEGNLAKTKVDLSKAEDLLADFQSTSRIASLPDAVTATIKSLSELEAERIRAAVQLKSMDETLNATRENISSLQVAPQIAIEMETKRRSLRAQESELKKAKAAFQEQLSNLPPKGIALARLQREVQVQNAVYLILTQQLATAELNENKESDFFLTLDQAIIPDRPASPQKKIFAGGGLALGLIIGAVLAATRNQRPIIKSKASLTCSS